MTSSASRTEESSVQRWGGITSIVGSMVFIIVFAIVITFVLPDPPEAVGLVERFPGVRVARTVENALYLAALALWIPSLLALYRTCRGSSPAAALFGSVIGIVGLGVLAVSTLPHIATVPISDLYHAPGATAEDRASLVLIWQATEGIFSALLVAGLLLVPAGVALLGVAMRATPALGGMYGGLSLVIGLAGVAAATIEMVGYPPAAAVSVLALIAFHLVIGTKLFLLSRGASRRRSTVSAGATA